MKYIISDIDGTVSDHRWRAHLARERKYDDYHSRAHLDQPHEAVVNLLRRFEMDHKIIQLTGRIESQREQTANWLEKFDVPRDILLMRQEPNFRISDSKAKLDSLGAFARSEHCESISRFLKRINFVIEDRDKVVAMWRRFGVTCFQVFTGEY